MKKWSDNLAFQLIRNTFFAIYAVIFIAVVVVTIKNIPEIIRSIKIDKSKEHIMLLAEKGEPFTLGQAIKFDWDEAKIITYQYDTGFGVNENDDYYCNIRCTFNDDYHILVLYKDKKYVVDFSFNRDEKFTFADNFEIISADTVLTVTKQEDDDGYILSIK